jgi:hypothetical protein
MVNWTTSTPSDIPAGTSQEDYVTALVAANRPGEALALAEQMIREHEESAAAWRALAGAQLAIGRLDAALEAAERALSLNDDDPATRVIHAAVLHRRGQSEKAIGTLEAVIATASPPFVPAYTTLAEALYRLGRTDELQNLVRRPEVASHRELAVFRAHAVASHDPDEAVRRFKAVVDDIEQPAMKRWVAGFQAIRLLDRQGRYREAFDLAVRLHGAKLRRWNVDALADDVSRQLDVVQRMRMQRGASAKPPANASLPVGLIAGLPRSGTTLLEQMLDRHPSVSGIGEYEGLGQARNVLVRTGMWPGNMASAPTEAIRAAAQIYLHGAVPRRRTGASWMIDKSLMVWNSLPAVAIALPGAACFHIARDPRDCAISIYLSNMHPETMGWNQDLESIRRVIAMERSLLPDALSAFGIPHVSIVYEQLVAHPKAYMQECLKVMGLPWDDAVLEPQKNTRTVHTLSHEQVRKPINDSSIGRWKNYAFAFDSSWDGLVAAHEARSRAEAARLAALESESAPSR